ncbi:MAG: hypothetical protein IJ297_02515 [Clostridia bacterium]|nr:hypothetical protein [Clostridia bacterium]
MPALDYFVTLFATEQDVTIEDLYLGYFDNGLNDGALKTTWLCEVNSSDKRYAKM